MESQNFFHEYLVTRGKYLQLHESFYHEIFILEQNSRKSRKFYATKVGAIQYISDIWLKKSISVYTHHHMGREISVKRVLRYLEISLIN